MPQQLRGVLREQLNTRYLRASPYEPAHEAQRRRAAYDAAVARSIQEPARGNTIAGEWLRNLVAYSLMQCSQAGSTTAAVATLSGNKMTHLHVGDSAIMVFRKILRTHTWEKVFATEPVFTNNNVPATPAQLFFPDPDSFCNVAYVRSVLGWAVYGVTKVCPSDIVVVCTDGVTDNLRGNALRDTIRTIVETHGINSPECPTLLAEAIVEAAVAAGVKPDDSSCAVGIVDVAA